MPAISKPTTYWQSALVNDLVGEPLMGNADTDIAIIGGGIVGVVIGLNLSLAGHDALLLEAGEIGSGATGASAGIVSPQLAPGGIEPLRSKVGQEMSRRLLSMLGEAGAYLFELARIHAPDCGAEQSGFIAPAMTRNGMAKLNAIASDCRPFRSDVSILDAEETRILTGLNGYSGALYDRSGGILNPLLYSQGIARGAMAAGARIHTHSAVKSLKRRGDRWLIETGAGRVRAKRVILCANAANGDIHPALKGTVLPLRVCEVATAPVGDELRARILPGRQALTDVELDVFSIRYNGEGGLITAYPAGPKLGDEEITKLVNDRLAVCMTGWQPLPLTHIWRGTAAVNSNLLPRLISVDEDLIAVQACNGRGIALNSILGRELARWIVAPERAEPPLPLSKPVKIPGYLVAKYAPELIMSSAMLLKRARQFSRTHFMRKSGAG